MSSWAVILGLIALGCLPVHARAVVSPESLGSFQHVAYARLTGAPGDISNLAQDADEFLWMKATHGSVRFDGTIFRAYSGVPAFLTRENITADPDGNHWSIARGELFVAVPANHTPQRIPGLPHGVRQIVLGTSGRVYILSDDGIHFYRRNGISLHEIAGPIEDRQINGLMESHTGALWVTRTSGVLHTSREALNAAEQEHHAPSMETFRRSNGLTGAFPQPILEDCAGDIWVGTEGGLDLFRRTAFTTVGLPEGIHQINAETDARGTTWVGSDNLPLLRVDADGTHPLADATSGVSAMTVDAHRDIVWAANERGLWRLDQEGASRVTPLPFPAGKGRVAFLAIDRAGRVVAAPFVTVQGPTPPPMAWNGSTWEAFPALSVPPVAAITDSQGAMWFALYGTPMLARLAMGKVSLVGAERGLDTGSLRAIVAASNGLWVGGDNGVQFYDGKRFWSIPLERPDLLRWVTGLAVDDAGFLWVETSALVFRSREPIANGGVAGRTKRLVFERFDYTDGIPGGADPSQGLPSLRKSADGRIWVKTVAGLSWIDPSRHVRTREPATPHVERIDVQGIPRAMPRGEVQLGPDQRDVAIRYTAAELSRPDEVRYQYRLQPISDTWTDLGQAREVFLTQLPPGVAVFEVRALAGSHLYSGSAVLRIHRQAAFEETTPFTVLVIASVAGLIGLLLLLRMRSVSRHLRIRAEEREAIARDIHDTLLQRLQGAMLTMESLSGRVNIPEDERHEIARVAEEARDVIVAGRERIQNLRGTPDGGITLYDRILAEGQRLAATHAMAFTLTLSGTPRPIHEEAADSLSTIAAEAMVNAFVHSQGTRVDVRISYENNGLWLAVADDGRGFDPVVIEQVSNRQHFGLRGMRERAAGLRGTVRLESAPGEGTEIHVRIPRRSAFA